MKTIQKRADELKPGDVIIGFGPDIPAVFVGFHDRDDQTVYVRFVVEGTDHIKREWISRATSLDVQAPVLTPAQERAEELLELVRKMAGVFKYAHTMSDTDVAAYRKEYVEMTHDLLAKIDPPKAPTYEEVLKALDALRNSKPFPGIVQEKIADDILDRARRAQVLHD